MCVEIGQLLSRKNSCNHNFTSSALGMPLAVKKNGYFNRELKLEASCTFGESDFTRKYSINQIEKKTYFKFMEIYFPNNAFFNTSIKK